MSDGLSHALAEAAAALDREDPHTAQAALAPFADQLADDVRVARLWAGLLHHASSPQGIERELARFAQAWAHDPEVMQIAAAGAVRWCRRHPLEAPARREPVARAAAECLRRAIHARKGGRGATERHALHAALARALTLVGPAVDDDALHAWETALTAHPEDGEGWFGLARLHTLRGRWRKGLEASQHALTLLDVPAVRWNLALCATALGEAEVAAQAWQALEHPAHVTLEGGAVVPDLPPVEVCLTPATLGLDGQPAGGDWQVEAVWVQPLSPAHGRLVHPTRLPGPADFDDVVLWDAEPESFRPVDGRDVPRFVALAVLRAGRAQTLPVAGWLPYPKALMRVDAALPLGCFVHSFDSPRKGDFHGKLVFPKGLDPASALSALEAAATIAEARIAPIR